MEESRSVSVKDKIVKLPDIISIGNLIFLEYEKLKNITQYSQFKVELDFEDDTEYRFKNEEFDAVKSYLENKRLEAISIILSSSDPLSIIAFTIKSGDLSYIRIRVEGTESTWVNGIFKKMEDTVLSWPPQNTVLKRYNKLIALILSLFLGYYFIEIIKLMPSEEKQYSEIPKWVEFIKYLITEYPLSRHIIQSMLGVIPTYFPSILLVDKISTLWPSVELQLGPNHAQVESRRRNIIYSIIILIVLPLLISIISKYF